METTTIQEGIVVRCIQRVEELMKNIRLAAKSLESKEFEAKLERCSKLIRRDIVFIPSLYTIQETVSVYNEDDGTGAAGGGGSVGQTIEPVGKPQLSEQQLLEYALEQTKLREQEAAQGGGSDGDFSEEDEEEEDDFFFNYKFKSSEEAAAEEVDDKIVDP